MSACRALHAIVTADAAAAVADDAAATGEAAAALVDDQSAAAAAAVDDASGARLLPHLLTLSNVALSLRLHSESSLQQTL